MLSFVHPLLGNIRHKSKISFHICVRIEIRSNSFSSLQDRANSFSLAFKWNEVVYMQVIFLILYMLSHRGARFNHTTNCIRAYKNNKRSIPSILSVLQKLTSTTQIKFHHYGYIFFLGTYLRPNNITFRGGKKEEEKKELYWTNIRTWKDQRYDDRGNEDGWWAYLGRTQGSGWSWQRVPGAERTCRPGPATAPAPDRAPPRRIGPRTQAPLESPM